MMLVATLWMTLAPLAALQTAQGLPAPSEFAASTVSVRRALMKDVDVTAQTTPEAAYELVAAGLVDPDAAVRETAAGSLRTLRSTVVRFQLDPRRRKQIAPPAPFLDQLAAAADSPDVAVRVQSIGAFVDFERNTDRVE